jgi:hypothetical protein
MNSLFYLVLWYEDGQASWVTLCHQNVQRYVSIMHDGASNVNNDCLEGGSSDAELGCKKVSMHRNLPTPQHTDGLDLVSQHAEVL